MPTHLWCIARNNNFDFLRFLFAFIVVVSHTIDLSGNETLLPLAPFSIRIMLLQDSLL